MEDNSTKADTDGRALFAGEAWFDPIEAGIRDRVRGFIEELLEQELTAALGGRSKHERAVEYHQGYRNGTRERQLMGSVPRARLADKDCDTREWRSEVLPRYARRTRQVEALIASAYLAGTNTRRVKRALAPLLKEQLGRTWSAELGARCRRTGRRGCGAILPEKTSYA
jgi:putative transposase